MIFKISSFLTLAFALSSLDAASVTAILVPKNHDGGKLNRRDSDAGVVLVNVFADYDIPVTGTYPE
jgi:hypothetical protein